MTLFNNNKTSFLPQELHGEKLFFTLLVIPLHRVYRQVMKEKFLLKD